MKTRELNFAQLGRALFIYIYLKHDVNSIDGVAHPIIVSVGVCGKHNRKFV